MILHIIDTSINQNVGMNIKIKNSFVKITEYLTALLDVKYIFYFPKFVYQIDKFIS